MNCRKIILIAPLLMAVSMSTIHAVTSSPDSVKIKEPKISDFANRNFSGLDDLDQESDRPNDCNDYNNHINLDKNRTVLIACQIDDSYEAMYGRMGKSKIFLSINRSIYYLPLISRPKGGADIGVYDYEASDKSVCVKIIVSSMREDEDGSDFYGTLMVLVNGKKKRYPISYYRGG